MEPVDPVWPGGYRVLAFFLGCWFTGLPTVPFFTDPFLARSRCFSGQPQDMTSPVTITRLRASTASYSWHSQTFPIHLEWKTIVRLCFYMLITQLFDFLDYWELQLHSFIIILYHYMLSLLFTIYHGIIKILLYCTRTLYYIFASLRILLFLLVTFYCTQ